MKGWALRLPLLPPAPGYICRHCIRRHLQTEAANVPLRKQLKDSAKRRKQASKQSPPPSLASDRLRHWELTVGIEIHARLSTTTKLFSPASLPTPSGPPNASANVAPFDLALPGTRPRFQVGALVPAIRAALAMGCAVQRVSKWDRKHYFYRDQPAGYQITQYYSPFALNGQIVLGGRGGRGGGEEVRVGIKQVQMEQDTAKSNAVSGGYHLDYSRVGAPLIEIITLPQIHSPEMAGALVRKVRDLLRLVGACEGNMENGDLRADVNVSVRMHGDEGRQSYAGVTGLGTRTEIKNLNSFKSVEDAVRAERDRQIEVLEGGGSIRGETRGWTVGGTETTLLRGKEGEVDYRYMPDPDLGPVYISEKLVDDLHSCMPEAPEQTLRRVVEDFGLSEKDAATIIDLDDGERLEFATEVREALLGKLDDLTPAQVGKAAANWTLHELGGLLTTANTAWQDLRVRPSDLASILEHLLQKRIIGRSAKQLLQNVFEGRNEGLTVEKLIVRDNLTLRPMSDLEYEQLTQVILSEHPDAVDAIQQKGQKGKVMFLVGQMMKRADEGTIEAQKAREVVERFLHI